MLNELPTEIKNSYLVFKNLSKDCNKNVETKFLLLKSKKPQSGLFHYSKLKLIYSNTFFYENTIHKIDRLSNRQ